MKKGLAIIVFNIFSCTAVWSQDIAQLQETANKFMQQNDFSNAVLVLNRALAKEPNNLEVNKYLALNYYFLKDFNKAQNIIKPLLEQDAADDQTFQIAADISLAIDDTKEAEKIYKKGLKKFPASGALYNEYGELLWAQKDFNAIKQWEKGIELDPGFSKNYYNASKYYYFTTDKVWSILYGEIFINIEPAGSNSPEIKIILLEGYKKLFAEADLEKNSKEKNEFIIAFIKTMNKQSTLALQGLQAESLTMIRSRFILDWFGNYDNQFPFRLFEYQRQLMQEGLFDAYNQWIFGAAQNLAAYQNWINIHSAEYTALNQFQKGSVFKIPLGQYFHSVN